MTRTLLCLLLALPGGALAAAVPSMPGATTLGGPNGCVKGFKPPSRVRLLHDLERAHQRWRHAGVYTYSFVLQTFSPPVRSRPTRVTVGVDGRVSAQVVGGGPAPDLARRATVEGLFEAVRQGLDRSGLQGCTEVVVAYAPDGHPTSFASASRRAGLADGGSNWTVTDFRRR